MQAKVIDELLDALILKTENKSEYQGLSKVQRSIAALQILVTTSTRGGLEVYFEPQYEFQHADALHGFKLIAADKFYVAFSRLLKPTPDKRKFLKEVTELGEAINEDSGLLQTAIQNFAQKEYNNLSRNINS